MRTVVFAILSLLGMPSLSAATIVPMSLEGGRPYIDVTLIAADGKHVVAHAWVDTGGGAVLVAGPLAAKLGLKVIGPKANNEGGVLAPVNMPSVMSGNMPISLQGQAFEIISTKTTLQGSDADLAIPGIALAAYDVVFDYPDGRFEVEQATQSKPIGTSSPVAIRSGMPTVDISVDGQQYGFLLDTGGTCTMISAAVVDAWKAKHPDWPRVVGAYGQGNMGFGKEEAQYSMLRVGHLKWGTFELTNVAAVSRPVGSYENFMSKILGTPIVGSIGGNVLQLFRVEINYPAGKLFLSRDERLREKPIDMIGAILEPAPQGGYDIVAIHGDVGNLRVGDHLLGVDGRDMSSAPLSAIIGALSGRVGTSHTLSIRRDGKRIDISVHTQTVLGALAN